MGALRPAAGPTRAGGGLPGQVLALPETLASRMARQLEAVYPREGCGVLLGRAGAGERRVLHLVETENRWEGRKDRYLVDPGTLRRLLEGEEEDGSRRVLGFYHSHPDAPAVPSETDLRHAWPWYHYLIVPVAGGRAGEGRVWELDGRRGRFVERALRIG